jgi:hypothetical protein
MGSERGARVASPQMGYKLLGFAVWQGGKWYVRRRFNGVRRKVVVAGLAGVVVAGVVVASRQQSE